MLLLTLLVKNAAFGILSWAFTYPHIYRPRGEVDSCQCGNYYVEEMQDVGGCTGRKKGYVVYLMQLLHMHMALCTDSPP